VPKSIWVARISILASTLILFFGSFTIAEPPKDAETPQDYPKSVIVVLKDIEYADSNDNDVVKRQRQEIYDAQNLLIDELSSLSDIKVAKQYDSFPMVDFIVSSEEAEKRIIDSILVGSIIDNKPIKLIPFEDPVTFSCKPGTYCTSSPIETIDGSLQDGFSDGRNFFNGDGFAVAVIDTGVGDIPLLNDKTIAERCFSFLSIWDDISENGQYRGISACHNGDNGKGSAQSSCHIEHFNAFAFIAEGDYIMPQGCDHGTGVSATAISPLVNITGNLVFRGVASDSGLVVVKTGHEMFWEDETVYYVPYGYQWYALYLADQIDGFDYINTHTFSMPVAAVNLSAGLGVADTDEACKEVFQRYDTENPFEATIGDNKHMPHDKAFYDIIASLTNKNIAVVVANGNYGDLEEARDKISAPACVNDSIAVGATDLSGQQLASYSNNGPLTDLLAPGSEGDLSILSYDGQFFGGAGTSFAAPQVAGAFAVLRSKAPNMTVDELLAILKETGKPIVDNRDGYTVDAKPLIQINAALAAIPTPITSVTVSPTSVSIMQRDTQQFTATVVGENYPDTAVAWSASGNSSANTQIDANGLLTIGEDESSETISIRSTSVVDSNKYSIAIVTITKSLSEISSVEISPTEATVQQKQTFAFSATVLGNGNPSQSVSWNITGNNSAGTNISNTGLLYVDAYEAAETINIIATSTRDTFKSATAVVAITKAPSEIYTITISPIADRVEQGKTKKFLASIDGYNNPPDTVSWSVSGSKDESTTISNNGLLSVGRYETAKTITVTAESTYDSTKRASIDITIKTVFEENGTPDDADDVDDVEDIDDGNESNSGSNISDNSTQDTNDSNRYNQLPASYTTTNNGGVNGYSYLSAADIAQTSTAKPSAPRAGNIMRNISFVLFLITATVWLMTGKVKP
jgi:hypothetical protein